MKRTIGMIAALLWACLLAFFGVFVSVFADGGSTERLITITAILAIYFVSGGICSYFGTFWSWQWSLLLGIPGALILLLYSISEISLLPYFLAYMLLIGAFSFTGTMAGNRFRSNRQK